MKSTANLKRTQHWRYALQNRVADGKTKLVNKSNRWVLACMGSDRDWFRFCNGLADVYRTPVTRSSTARFLQPF